MTTSSEERFMGLMLRLRGHGIDDKNLLKAIEETPHDEFVPVMYKDKAWEPHFLPLECGQTMPPPDLVVRVVDALQLWPSYSLLEVGTGSGFQTAILARLVRSVRSIERYKTLSEAAKARLQALKVANVTLDTGDGSTAAGEAAYDRIVVNAAFPEQPKQYLECLTGSGVLVTAIGEPGKEQMLVKLSKVGKRYERQDLFKVRFQPLQMGVAATL